MTTFEIKRHHLANPPPGDGVCAGQSSAGRDAVDRATLSGSYVDFAIAVNGISKKAASALDVLTRHIEARLKPLAL